MMDHTEAACRLLLPQHRALILDSGIAPHIAEARGYRSVTTKADLKRLGFSDAQRSVPTLLIPIWNVFGQIAIRQHRPDHPRIAKYGKPVKYETPCGSRMVLDVHPFVRHRLADPAIPLWITEGVRKADAAVSIGLCCIALLGVWNWRGTNDQRGTTVLPDFEAIALKGRTVYLVFDSDVMTKAAVYGALARLKAFLEARGAVVLIIYLPSGPAESKIGLDDYLVDEHTVDDLLALASPELRRPVELAADGGTGPYVATPNGIVWRKPVQDGWVEVPLANFTARITEEVIADDGLVERGEVLIDGVLAGGAALSPIRVPVARFAALDWVVARWGTRAVVSAGMGQRDRLREAIQRLSRDVTRRRIYAHPGWRRLPEHGWGYLHAGGAITADGSVSVVEVALHGAASRLSFPDPPAGDDVRAAVRASLALLDLAPDRITAPLLAVAYRAPLCEVIPIDVALFLVGPTGQFKSELAALLMQHFGVAFDRLHLPAQWSATPNFLERIGFDFKDAPVVIDDFAPAGSIGDIQRLHATADRVLRGAGNRGGRGRMQADGTARPDLPPRGLIIGTGEDAPRGQSLRARTVIVEIEPGDVCSDRLAAAQADGRDGHFVAAMAGYLQWLAPRLDVVRDEAPRRLTSFRDRASGCGSHRRTPDGVAHLALGWATWLDFAVEVAAIAQDEADALFERVWRGLGATAARQGEHQIGEEPARRFLDLLASALAGGFAHLAAPDGRAPARPAAWGWREAIVGVGDQARVEWRPQGTRLGWIDGEELYLDLEAALTAAQRIGQATGSTVAVGPKTLAKRLRERGFLRSTEQEHGEVRVRRVLDGMRRRVLHLRPDAAAAEESGQSGQSGQSGGTGGEQAQLAAIRPADGRISGPDSASAPDESGQQIRPDDNTQRVDGRNGRIGRVVQTVGASDGNSEDATDMAVADGDGAAEEIVEWTS